MFNKRLREIRREQKYTMKSAAEALGMPFSTYSKYESGERTPDIYTLAKLADFFGCTTDYLLGRTDVRMGHVIEKEKMPSELESMGVTSVTKIGANELTSQEIEVLKKFAAQLTQQD